MTGRQMEKLVPGLAALVALWLSAPAMADPPPAIAPEQPASKTDNPGPRLDTITVEAQSQRELIEHQISSFVGSIAIHPGDESMARWQSPVCPLVAGLPREKGEFVLARLSQVARDARVRLAPEKCQANFFVVLTSEPEVLLKEWWARDWRLFTRDRGIGGIDRFIGTPRPVRIWYNVHSGCPDGVMTATYASGGMFFPSCSNGRLGSRLIWETVRGIGSVIVVVDLRRTDDLNLGQLSDYVAMIGLAHIRENADPPGPAPTILRLFNETGAARPQSLSTWDQAYLRALYDTDQTSTMQLADIKLRLYRDVIPLELNPTAPADSSSGTAH